VFKLKFYRTMPVGHRILVCLDCSSPEQDEKRENENDQDSEKNPASHGAEATSRVKCDELEEERVKVSGDAGSGVGGITGDLGSACQCQFQRGLTHGIGSRENITL